MVHLCVAIHDKTGRYSKYAAVTLCSIFENTTASICVHLLHDFTLKEEMKNKFIELCDRYGQEIKFYLIDTQMFASIEHMTTTFTVGTLFRLVMPQIIPSEITKMLYMDVDIVANIDIQELWNINIDEYYCAACKEPEISYREVPQNILAGGLVDKNDYCNAGIVLFNLQRVRKSMNFLRDSISFLQENPQCIFSDQDAINFLFRDKIKILPPKWNVYSRHIRNTNHKLQKCIYHISGDYINTEQPECFDDLFFEYLHKLNWQIDEKNYYISSVQAVKKRFDLYKVLMNKLYMLDLKKVYWGCNSDHLPDVLEYVGIKTGKDYFVDSNIALQGKKIKNIPVRSPQVLLSEKKDEVVVIVVSKVYYAEIRDKLLEYGFEENENFFDGIALLSTSQSGYGEYY